jgi:hypothetical protein
MKTVQLLMLIFWGNKLTKRLLRGFMFEVGDTMDAVTETNPSIEGRAKVKRDVCEAIYGYRQLRREGYRKLQARQSALSVFFNNEADYCLENDAWPGSSSGKQNQSLY